MNVLRAARAPADGAEGNRPPGSSGIRLLPSPGLRLPPPQAQPASALVATPIRTEPVRPAPTRTVRLAADVLRNYTPAAVTERLLGSYGNPEAQVRLVVSVPGDANSVDAVLRQRGLSLDTERYAQPHRVYWNGDTGSRGYWINLPGQAPSRFVLIAGPSAGVIAAVHQQGTALQVSDAVAASLGMIRGAWSDIHVVALSEDQQVAARRTRTRAN